MFSLWASSLGCFSFHLNVTCTTVKELLKEFLWKCLLTEVTSKLHYLQLLLILLKQIASYMYRGSTQFSTVQHTHSVFVNDITVSIIIISFTTSPS